MKKFLCALLVLMMGISAMAVAEFVPSKTTSDMTTVAVVTETGVVVEDLKVVPVAVESEEHKEKVEVCNTEVQKLAQAENVVAYFGEVKDKEGNVIDIHEILESETANVFEFCPLVVEGYEPEMGKIAMTMQFSTPYEVDAAVIVVIGFVAEDGTIAWTAYEAVVTEEGIQIEFDAETMVAIQEGTALMAVISK